MNGRFVVMALAVALCAAVLSPVLASAAPVRQYGYSAEVRERMMVRNLAPTQLDDSVRPVVARDAAAGAGIFDYSLGPMGYGWPLIAAGNDSLPYNIAMLDSSGSLLSRTRMPTWGNWDSVFGVAGSGNQPMFETHNIASSEDGNKVCITWVRTDTSPMPGYYRLSSDAGATWGPIQELERPPAYGGDTLTSFHVSSLYPFYDDSNRLHVMAAVHPVVHDTAFIMPAGIWHWCPDWSPNWMLIRRAGCDPEHLAASVGYNALYACRPSGMWFKEQRVVLAVWEQFDSVNVEPLTTLLRAGIHFCSFDEQGISDTMCIAQPGSCSCRFPAVAAYRSGSEWDTAFVQYEIDQVAGFYPLGQGACTNNPIAVRRVPLYMPSHLGQLDTIGGTTYDLQTCGPAHPMLSCAPEYGVHASWMYSEDTTGSFPDLNARYNYYDFSSWTWNWIDPDYMQSGVNVFPYRAGAGSLDAEPATGVAVISACAPPILPHVAAEERPKPQAASLKPAATLVRGVLRLPISPFTLHTSLFDMTGRQVMALQPGANDVSGLAPGLYFVRERSAVSGERSAIYCHKVVLAE
jgi:hypothetical protein